MEYFSIQKDSGYKVSCVREVPDQPKGIVIAVHGFTSSKESPTYRRLLNRFPTAGYGVICIDLPGHGTEESAREPLRIPGAIDSIEAAERYAAAEYPGCEIFYFGSSFGAYLIGLYISTREHSGRKAFWRSGAVNMPELFHKDPPGEEEKRYLRELEKKGFVDFAMDHHSPVRIIRPMYNDLRESDLFEIFDAGRFGQNQIAMAHGREDSVISPEAVERFAARFQIPVTWFPGEGHSLSGHKSTPDKVVDLAIGFFN